MPPGFYLSGGGGLALLDVGASVRLDLPNHGRERCLAQCHSYAHVREVLSGLLDTIGLNSARTPDGPRRKNAGIGPGTAQRKNIGAPTWHPVIGAQRPGRAGTSQASLSSRRRASSISTTRSEAKRADIPEPAPGRVARPRPPDDNIHFSSGAG